MMRWVLSVLALVCVVCGVGSANAYGPVPDGFVSVYFSGPIPVPNAETVVVVTSCVSNETKTQSYPAQVRFELFRSELTVGNPNLAISNVTRDVNAPGFAPEASLTLTNGSGTTNVLHVRILAGKAIASGLLCHAFVTDSVTTPTYSAALPLVRRAKLKLPKDVAQ